MKKFWKNLVWWLNHHFGGIVKCKCGHTCQRFDVVVFNQKQSDGKILRISRRVYFNDKFSPWCAKCMSEKTIGCAICGKPIWPGDPIAVISSSDEKLSPQAVNIRTEDRPLYPVCIINECAPPEVLAGRWVMPGNLQKSF